MLSHKRRNMIDLCKEQEGKHQHPWQCLETYQKKKRRGGSSPYILQVGQGHAKKERFQVKYDVELPVKTTLHWNKVATKESVELLQTRLYKLGRKGDYCRLLLDAKYNCRYGQLFSLVLLDLKQLWREGNFSTCMWPAPYCLANNSFPGLS